MIGFISDLYLDNDPKDEGCWKLEAPLVYESEIVGKVTVPTGFCTDLASVPRLPVVYLLWGNRAHREGIIHDYLYRCDSQPVVSFETANKVFLEAMKSRGKPWWVRWFMYAGVCAGGRPSYHRKTARTPQE